jgi:hypothetical protein
MQAPYVIGVLAGSREYAVKTKICTINRFGILYLALLE